jgi:Low affinity iron permease
VLWRKVRQGPDPEQGAGWVERLLAVRETGRLQGVPTFPGFGDAVTCPCTGQPPDVPGADGSDPLNTHNLKLNEVIRVLEGAQNTLLDLEDQTEDELTRMRAQYEALARRAREELGRRHPPAAPPEGAR